MFSGFLLTYKVLIVQVFEEAAKNSVCVSV